MSRCDKEEGVGWKERIRLIGKKKKRRKQLEEWNRYVRLKLW